MYILSLVAQQAIDSAYLSVPALRDAALTFYQKDKYSVIQTNADNRQLLDWIRDSVIGKRRTRAFLLPVGTNDPIIERLFDQRAPSYLQQEHVGSSPPRRTLRSL